MKQVYKIQTFDGELHNSKNDALHYLDKLYADKLCPLAGKLARIDKYTPMCEFIDANLSKFLELDAIKQDRILLSDDDNFLPWQNDD